VFCWIARRKIETNAISAPIIITNSIPVCAVLFFILILCDYCVSLICCYRESF